MAEVFVTFKQNFVLALDSGHKLNFVAGPQKVDEALANHWYVRAMRSDLNPAMELEVGGTKEYLKEDLEIARRILQEEAASKERLKALHGLRTRASESQVHATLAGMYGRDLTNLTPAQRELANAADRQITRQNEERAKELLSTIDEAVVMASFGEEPAIPQPTPPDGNEPVVDAAQGAEPATGQDNGTAAAPKGGRPSLAG